MEESTEHFINKLKRDINCLLDSDRGARRAALEKLTSEISSAASKENVKILLNEYLISPLLKCLEDKIEKHREMTIKLLMIILDSIPELDRLIISMMINSILSRVDHIPFLETCMLFVLIIAEELRQSLINVLSKILINYHQELRPSVPQMCKMISTLLNDPCPEVKIKLSEFIISFCNKLRHDIGPHCKSIVASLNSNLKHSHNKIRKVSLNVSRINLNVGFSRYSFM